MDEGSEKSQVHHLVATENPEMFGELEKAIGNSFDTT
jgi:hypothetical protein